MIVRRSNSVHPVRQLRDEMDRLFTDFFPGVRSPEQSNGRGYPALNVWDDDDHVYVEAEVPGLRQSELDVSLVGNELSLKGTREDRTPGQSTYHRRERVAASFERTLRLPVDVDGERVQASLKDGVMLVTLPKAKAAKPRKIAVTTE
jgi:HSP20 family protein